MTQPDLPAPEQAPYPGYDMEDSMGYLVARVRSLLMAQLTQETSRFGLTSTQATMLYKLATGKCTTAADLSREYCIDASAVTRLLDRLEKHGLLIRERSREDRRTVILTLTAEGRAQAMRMPEIFLACADRLLRGFTPDEVTLLKSLLRRVIANSEIG
ncbi:MarR family transcriptional regulator [Pandoraea sp.]|uniref:MarR family winged helix-turn-helix transcriptional regulator n=1 Tax=Pandoraea sp. TaxID=1883445 RepID=UPI0011FE2658|nr:MarR family transcriptional regulator [Pandoraea sp.]TAL52332.1 MAG: MarR family transcriptional regulator [Pandoraea sp.]TAM16142.1 MAG: MarR family transcriptional regulator [Pandoraea sp.]